eukprot:4002123-Amphidinium_carterae.2
MGREPRCGSLCKVWCTGTWLGHAAKGSARTLAEALVTGVLCFRGRLGLLGAHMHVSGQRDMDELQERLPESERENKRHGGGGFRRQRQR